MHKDPAAAERIRAPALGLLLRETRVALEVPRFVAFSRLARLPPGDGHAVVVLPGFGASDLHTRPLRRALQRLGYDANGWGLGRNLGMRPAVKAGLADLLDRLYERSGGPVSLIGWSLGGVFARELARHKPQKVRRVFTLGSPINGEPDANNMMPLFRLANRGKPVNPDRAGFDKRKQPPAVPCVALYSRSDGIVAWQCCLEPEAANTENVEVRGSHFGLPSNLQVLRALAERLAKV